MSDIQIPKSGEVWEHYRNKDPYIIVALAREESTQELRVVYQDVDHQVWVRPLENFLELLKDGSARFAFVGASTNDY